MRHFGISRIPRIGRWSFGKTTAFASKTLFCQNRALSIVADHKGFFPLPDKVQGRIAHATRRKLPTVLTSLNGLRYRLSFGSPQNPNTAANTAPHYIQELRQRFSAMSYQEMTKHSLVYVDCPPQLSILTLLFSIGLQKRLLKCDWDAMYQFPKGVKSSFGILWIFWVCCRGRGQIA